MQTSNTSSNGPLAEFINQHRDKVTGVLDALILSNLPKWPPENVIKTTKLFTIAVRNTRKG